MKSRVVSLTAMVLITIVAIAVPASAGTIYSNGPINGTIDAWTINFNFEVSDSFTVTGGNSTVNGLSFGAWLAPGDTAISVEVSLTSNEAGGTTFFDQVVSLTQSNCVANQFGFNVCEETGNFNGPQLANGSYWLNLQNAVVNTGDPLYWDENDGPSEASNDAIGTLPSESFTMLGSTGGGTTPEPGSLLLFASGVVSVAGVVRRKLL
jgi:hypothetical protein